MVTLIIANSCLKRKALIILLSFLFIFVLLLPLRAFEERIIQVSFQEIPLREAFVILGHLSEINMVFHPSVEGTTSLQLKEVSFIEALNILTKIHQLAYYRTNNSIIIGPYDYIQSVFEVEEQSVYPLQYISAEKAMNLIEPVFPGLRIQPDDHTQRLILMGSNKNIQGAITLLKDFDRDVPVREKGLLVYPLKAIEPTVAFEVLTTFFPMITYQLEARTNSLILQGPEVELQRARGVISDLDWEEELVEEEVLEDVHVEVFFVEHGEAALINEVIANTFSHLQVQLYGTRSIILKGAQQEIESAVHLLTRLDYKKRQVLIEVQIEEISVRAKKELGISDITDLTFFKIDDGGITAEFPNILTILQEKGASETLARPRLTTIDGEEARLIIGDEIPFVIRGEEGERIEYLNAGIILDVLPRISHDDTITLRISPEISSFIEIGKQLPQITTRKAETTVRVKDGESIIIGGLIKDDEFQVLKKIPFFSELPLLGHLFQRSQMDHDKSEVIIILTPYIIDDYMERLDLKKEVIVPPIN